MPYSSSTSFMAPKKPSGGTVNPPTPWIGSAIMQATSPAVVVVMMSRRSSTQAWMNAGSSRSRNGLRNR